jgi:hypothetical protein
MPNEVCIAIEILTPIQIEMTGPVDLKILGKRKRWLLSMFDVTTCVYMDV